MFSQWQNDETAWQSGEKGSRCVDSRGETVPESSSEYLSVKPF